MLSVGYGAAVVPTSHGRALTQLMVSELRGSKLDRELLQAPIIYSASDSEWLGRLPLFLFSSGVEAVHAT